MMKLTIAVTILLLASASSGGMSGVKGFGLSGGAFVPTGDLSDAASPGGMVSISSVRGIGNSFALTGFLSFYFPGEGDFADSLIQAGGIYDLTLYAGGIGLRYMIAPDNSFSPYIEAGIGFDGISQDVIATDFSLQGSDMKPGFFATFGSFVRLGESVAFDLNARFHHVPNHIWVFEPTGWDGYVPSREASSYLTIEGGFWVFWGGKRPSS
jgi:opacity protein-like surface antigen